MSEHTQMPPRLDSPWNFGDWDHRQTFTPPWQYRGFRYHGETGDRLVIVWRWGFGEGGSLKVCGDIYRCNDILEAILLSNRLRETVDHSDWGGGLFIFFPNSGICEPSIYGEPFPEPLPNGRWL